jgi:hypothetical protein
MTMSGRPGVPYKKFVEIWEQLVVDGKASNNAAQQLLGGSKSTIGSFRERYEREKTDKVIGMINSIQLTEAVKQAIAQIKVKEILELEKIIAQLNSRSEEYLSTLKETEDKLAASGLELDEAKLKFETQHLDWERNLAVSQVRFEDRRQQEQLLIAKYEKLNEQYNQAKQEAAVAKKEVEMLREQKKLQ